MITAWLLCDCYRRRLLAVRALGASAAVCRFGVWGGGEGGGRGRGRGGGGEWGRLLLPPPPLLNGGSGAAAVALLLLPAALLSLAPDCYVIAM